MIRHPPKSPLFPYTPLFRPPHRGIPPTAAVRAPASGHAREPGDRLEQRLGHVVTDHRGRLQQALVLRRKRSEEHTSELQSRSDLVCRLLLEKKQTRAATHQQ